MPTVLRKYGIRFHFYGSDMGEPPHIHASGKGGVAKVWLGTTKFAGHKGFTVADQKRIIEVVTQYRAEILEAWHAFARTVR